MADVYSNCGCGTNCGDTPDVRVVAGNDLTVEALVSVYDRDSGVYKPLDLSGATDVALRLVGTFSKVPGRDTTATGSRVSAFFPGGSIGVGIYGVEITFVDSLGKSRIFERNLIRIVSASGEATVDNNIEGETGEGLNVTVNVLTRTVRIGTSGAGGQDNVIEKIKVNGTELPVENKEVNITVPTKVSELENDSNFLTEHQDLSNYVQKEDGKGLSTKDFTQEDKDKLDGIENGAQKNVQPDWNADPGTPGAILNKPDMSGGSSTVDAELDAESTNAVQNKAVTKAITELQDYCFPTSLEASISPSSAEWTGNSVEVSVSFRVLRNSKPVVADTVQIQFNGETKTLENVAEGSEKFTLSTQGYKSGSVTAKKGSTTIKNSPRSISANLYLPVYYGFSKATTGNELTITSLTKGGSSLNGTNTLTNDDATKYLWLCVPNTMSINKVTSSGFDVPFLAPVEASTPLGTYKCYRTKDLPGAGSMTIVIS
uniref:Tail fiber protein n=1 Tax=virus sp. ctee23 TaxID=2826809 RepID=A0A8S5R7A8_9VIRU|nr:MAG TPA: hypothetical protein [virus sp. ctee23]